MKYVMLFEHWLTENELTRKEFEDKITELAPKIDELLVRKNIGNIEKIRCRVVGSDWGYESGSPMGDYNKAVIMGTITKQIRKPFKKTETKTWNTLIGTLIGPTSYCPAETHHSSTTEWKHAVEQGVEAVMKLIPDAEIDMDWIQQNPWFEEKYPNHAGRGESLGKQLDVA